MLRPLPRVASPLGLLALTLVGALVLAGGWLWLARDDGGAEVVGDRSPDGWTTIRYQGVRVDIPASWERSDRDGCEFQFEVWTPPGSKGCDWAGGVAFYASATYDPADKPGVRRTESRDEPEWGGYSYAGDLVVYAADDDRKTVVRVLDSVGLRDAP